jgi:hypothetical protein
MPPLEARNRSEPRSDEERRLVAHKEKLQRELHLRAYNAGITHPQPRGLMWPRQSAKAVYKTEHQQEGGQSTDEFTRTWIDVRYDFRFTNGDESEYKDEAHVEFFSDRVIIDKDGQETVIKDSQIEHFSMDGCDAKIDTGTGVDLSTEQVITMLEDTTETMTLIEEVGRTALAARLAGQTAVEAS